ncbi:MAG: PQQ-dependent sugar dehydrogenase [Myxococcota bacterium]
MKRLATLLILFACTPPTPPEVTSLTDPSRVTECQPPVLLPGEGELVDAPTCDGGRAPPLTLRLPPGFCISHFWEQDNAKPRLIAFSPSGDLWVSDWFNRIWILPDDDHDGVADASIRYDRDGLTDGVHGIHFSDGFVWLGEADKVSRIPHPGTGGGREVGGEKEVILTGIPTGGHWTRTARVKDGWVYVGIGSQTNAGPETHPWRAAIIRAPLDALVAGGIPTDRVEIYGAGLRNPVDFTWHPTTGELFASINERDELQPHYGTASGDNLPFERIARVTAGSDHGWPRCFPNRTDDGRDFLTGAPECLDSNKCDEFCGATDCRSFEVPAISLQAHSAPLGLSFYTRTEFPEPYRGALFVGFHGSWNRSEPTGAKVVALPYGAEGKPTGQILNFATGWQNAQGVRLGRPVDARMGPDGAMYITDDSGVSDTAEVRGNVYVVRHVGP